MKLILLILSLMIAGNAFGADGVLGVTNGTTTLGPGSGGGGGPQVWTNDNGVIRPASVPLTGVDVLEVPLLVGTSNSQAKVLINNQDFSFITADGTVAIDLYSYHPFVGSPTLNGVFWLGSEGVYGDGVFFDPGNDNGKPSPFSFTTTYSNSVANSSQLLAIQNNHTNKLLLMGNGDIYWGADATVGYRPPSTNALPGQVFASDGGTPQQISFDYLRVKMTQNTTATATFVTTGQSETIYDDSGTTIASLTINLPATTIPGQVVRYVTKAIATSVTVNGTVSVGATITTLAANSAIAWQATDTAGTFIRIE